MRETRADVGLVGNETLERVVDRGRGIGEGVSGIREQGKAVEDRRSEGAGEDGASCHGGRV
jgi:hypothetical protein